MNKKELTERDICSKFITPSLEKAGWDTFTQIFEEFPLTKGRIIVRGQSYTRAKNKRADYVLFYKPNIPIAIIEAKDNNNDLFLGEAADLLYHYLVLLSAKNIRLKDVLGVLQKRHQKKP